MDLPESPDEHKEVIIKVTRFESMLKKKENYYFDCEEFQDIIEYYLYKSDFKQAENVVVGSVIPTSVPATFAV